MFSANYFKIYRQEAKLPRVTKTLPNLKEVTTTFTENVTLKSTLEGKQVLIPA